MMRSDVGHNHANKKINTSKVKYEMKEKGTVDSAFQKAMLRTLLPMNGSQISAEIPLLFVVIFHKVWDGREGGSKKKDGGS